MSCFNPCSHHIFNFLLEFFTISVFYSFKVIKVFQRGTAEGCKPRCLCANNTEDLTDRFCCDCPPDEILNDCVRKKCKAACTNDGGNTYECCHCPGHCFSAKSAAKLATGKTITMAELKIGDKVQTGMDTEKVTSIGYWYSTFINCF